MAWFADRMPCKAYVQKDAGGRGDKSSGFNALARFGSMIWMRNSTERGT
jgi:hypothetical protein